MSTSITVWILMAVCYTSYFLVSMVYKRLGVHNLQTALLATNGLRFMNLKHLLGIILFGIIFYVVAPESRCLVEYIEVPRLKVLLPFIVILFSIAYLSNLSIEKRNLKYTSNSDYGFSNALAYFTIRFVFLLCYEFFFRGVLLFTFSELVPMYWAIVIATALYVLIHVFDSRKELLGAIPFGILLCLFSYLTNSIWYAFLIHLALSAVYEIQMFYVLTFKNKLV